ncbi:hypothetical protein GCM10011490_02550 [Pseudoclavibacter endophyticus]|nr:hypothetical protein GCM10011490_02550 [Pseudoclavibacter endophyticus]
MYGADTEVLRAIASETNRIAASIGVSESTATTSVAGVEWTGPDATRYHSDWAETAGRTRALADVAAALAGVLRRNADEQDLASAAGGGPNGPGTPPSPGEDGSGEPRDRGPQPDDAHERNWFDRTVEDLLDDGRVTWWQSNNGEWTLESGVRTIGGFSFGANGNLWDGQEARWDIFGDQRGGRVGPKDNEAFLIGEGALGVGLDLARMDYGGSMVGGSAAVTAEAAAAASARVGTGGADARVGVSAFAGAKASLSAAEPIPIIGDYVSIQPGVDGRAGAGVGANARVGYSDGNVYGGFRAYAAWGLGAGVDFGVNVDVARIGEDAYSFAEGVANDAGWGDEFERVVDIGSGVIDGAGEAIGDVGERLGVK